MITSEQEYKWLEEDEEEMGAEFLRRRQEEFDNCPEENDDEQDR